MNDSILIIKSHRMLQLLIPQPIIWIGVLTKTKIVNEAKFDLHIIHHLNEEY